MCIQRIFFLVNYDQTLSFEGEVSEGELLDAINSFSPGKSPGIYDIPIELFFKEMKKHFMIRQIETAHCHITPKARSRHT